MECYTLYVTVPQKEMKKERNSRNKTFLKANNVRFNLQTEYLQVLTSRNAQKNPIKSCYLLSYGTFFMSFRVEFSSASCICRQICGNVSIID